MKSKSKTKKPTKAKSVDTARQAIERAHARAAADSLKATPQPAEDFDDPRAGLDPTEDYRPEEGRNPDQILALEAKRGFRDLEDHLDSSSSGKDDRWIDHQGTMNANAPA